MINLSFDQMDHQLIYTDMVIDIDWLNNWLIGTKVTSEARSMDEEPQKYNRSRSHKRSVVLSTPPTVHVHIGSDGPTSNGSISSRGYTARILTYILECFYVLLSMYPNYIIYRVAHKK